MKKYIIAFTHDQQTFEAIKSYGWKYCQKHPLYNEHIVIRSFNTLPERKAYLIGLKDGKLDGIYTIYRK